MSERGLNSGRCDNHLVRAGVPIAMAASRFPSGVGYQRFRVVRRWPACFFWFALVVLLLQANISRASGGAALRRFSNTVHTFQAQFTQRQSDEQGNVVKTQRGRVWLLRPTTKFPHTMGKFRWVYETPYKQLIVNNGSKLWVYDPGLKQVTVRSAQKALTGSPAALLLAQGTLATTFRIRRLSVGQGLVGVRLTPRSKSSDFKSVDLLLRGETPVRMLFRDQMGDITDIRFSRVRINRPITPNLFTFQLPQGVEVVHAGSGQSRASAR